MKKVLRALDLRVYAICYPGWFSLLFLVVVIVFGTYGNWRVLSLRGGILDDALPEEDKYRQMQQWVEQKDGFNYSEGIFLLIRCPYDEIACFREILQVSKELEDRRETVLSLATVPNYVDTGERLLDDPYIFDHVFTQNFNIKAWKEDVLSDGSVANLLIDESMRWTLVGKLPPADHNEIKSGWETVEYLENRSIPWWERVFKNDIYSAREHVTAGGWIMGRWLIDQGLNRDMILLVCIGLGIVFPVFWRILSLRQASLATFGVVAMGIWLTRAGIFPLHAWDARFYERVYTILAYASIVVQGISFPLHRFKSFRNATGSSQERFMAALAVDKEIAFVAIIAMFAFSTLSSFSILQMREMGYQAIMGVGVVFCTSTIFIPALYLQMDKLFGEEYTKNLSPIADKKRKKQFDWLYVRPDWAVGIPVGFFLIGCILYSTGLIQSHTVPFDYITGTSVHKTFTFQKEMGSGNEVASFFIEPQDSRKTIQDLEFLQRAWEFQNALRLHFGKSKEENGDNSILHVIAVSTILDKVAEITRESYHKPFPDDPVEVEDIFFSLETINPRLREWMYVDTGLRMSVSILMNESDKLGALIERIIQFAESYPEIKISGFGTMQVYPRVDWYLNKGMPANTALSLTVLLIFYTGWAITARAYINPLIAGCALILPFLFSAGVIAIVMWIGNIPLSMSTVPIGDLAINASCDFSIYPAKAFVMILLGGTTAIHASRLARRREGYVVALDCLFNALAFAPLLVSQFGPIRQIGWMIGVMLGAGLVGALAFVPSALTLAVRKVH